MTEGTARGTIAVRVPGWSRDAKVSAITLRNLLTPGSQEYAEDEKESREENGYVFFSGEWAPGDRIEMFFDMPVRMLAADPRVTETAGQVCFKRGPITYCAEAADNGEGLAMWRVDAHSLAPRLDEIQTKEMTIAGAPVLGLTIPAEKLEPEPGQPLYRDWTPQPGKTGTLTLIPYFAWDNRGENEMRVWLYTR